jgi:GxxExxY protein
MTVKEDAARHGVKNGGREDPLTRSLVGAAIEVHKALGPGLLESVYEECLAFELAWRKIAFERQVPVPIEYRGKRLHIDLRIDLLVDRQLIVELKAVEAILPVHEAQLLTYLRLTKLRRGLLINFNVPVLKDGLKRMVNGYGSH